MTFRHLRLVKRQLLAEYQVNKFARRMLEGQLYQPKPPPQHPQWVLYHSWKVGVVELDEEDAMILRSLMGGSTDIDSEARRLELVEELREIGLCEDEPIDLNELVDSNPFHAIQNSYELRQFLSIAKEVEPRVVVEIGTARGGTFYCLSQIARPDATLISRECYETQKFRPRGANGVGRQLYWGCDALNFDCDLGLLKVGRSR